MTTAHRDSVDNWGMDTTFRFLHLTDLHIGGDKYDSLWPAIREAFVADLKNLVDRDGHHRDGTSIGTEGGGRRCGDRGPETLSARSRV